MKKSNFVLVNTIYKFIHVVVFLMREREREIVIMNGNLQMNVF